jgi:Flp pilus assembly protein TadD
LGKVLGMDVFAVQDEISRTIVATLVAHVNKAEAERTLVKPPATWQAHDLFMRASVLGLARYMLKEHSRALPPLRECTSRAPKMRQSHVWLAANLAQLGRLDEAHAEAAEVLRIDPNYTIDGTQRQMALFKRPEDAEHLFDGLRKAGLPER